MSDAAIIRAGFSDFKIVKGRKVAQLVFEVALEEADHALKILGGVPMPHEDRWCALALLQMGQPQAPAPPEPATVVALPPAGKRPWREIKNAQQAGMMCTDPDFIAWLAADGPEAAANEVRKRCGVASRADLDRDPDAAEAWFRLSRDFFDRKNLESLEKAYYGR